MLPLRLVPLLLLLTAIGCGESRKSAPVTGTVTLNGQPVADVIVRFQPSGSGTTEQLEVGMSSFGTTDAAGKFTLRFSDNSESGAMIGDHTVTIDEVTPPEEENNDAGGIGRKKTSRIPRKWGDGSQTFKVEDKDNVAAFSLD